MNKNKKLRSVFAMLALVSLLGGTVAQGQSQTGTNSGTAVRHRKPSKNRSRIRMASMIQSDSMSGNIADTYTGKVRLQKGEPMRQATLDIGGGVNTNLPGIPGPVMAYPFKLTLSDGGETKSGCMITFIDQAYTPVAMNFGACPASNPSTVSPDLILSLRACNNAVGRTGRGILLQRPEGDAFFASGNANCRRRVVVMPVVAKNLPPKPPKSTKQQKPPKLSSGQPQVQAGSNPNKPPANSGGRNPLQKVGEVVTTSVKAVGNTTKAGLCKLPHLKNTDWCKQP